jgi:hypothetical protein
MAPHPSPSQAPKDTYRRWEARPSQDPIFAAIKAHEHAREACNSVLRRVREVGEVAEEAGLLSTIEAPDCRNGPFRMFVDASSVSEINELVGDDEELRQFYHAKLSERNKERLAFEIDKLGRHPDDVIGEAWTAEWQALQDFVEVVPTTMAGLFAKLAYVRKLAEDPNFDHFDDTEMTRPLLMSLAQCCTPA